PNAAPGISQKELIDGVYEKLESVFGIDAYSSLSSNAEKYIYYRLDHHWTSLGAYLAYSTSSKQLGFTPVPLEKFNIEHASHNFRGSLYSKVIYDRIEADNIDLYTYGNGSHATDVEIFDGNKWSKAEDIYFREYLRKKDQYAVFLGQNQPIITVHTDTKNGKNLLVFKDSYIHSMLPFLALHYEKITLVDLRYMKASFENWVDLDEYQQTLFCYNVKNFAVDADIQKINFPVSQK
ncbi:MAG: DHHW family protein, partial [Oscillospiraceae bacterium]